jgi:hypothetical protein
MRGRVAEEESLLLEAPTPRIRVETAVGVRAEGRARSRHGKKKSTPRARPNLGSATQALLAQPVDLVVLNDVPPLFGRHVVTEGRRLLVRDARCDHDFLRDVQLRAADLAPWLARMRALKLASLRR